MLNIILSLFVGSLLVYISKYNFQPVTINLGYIVLEGIPLFYVILASLLVGLVLSYFAYIINAISNSFILRGKDGVIKKNKAEVLELTKRVHQLEIKNEKLGKDSGIVPGDNNAL